MMFVLFQSALVLASCLYGDLRAAAADSVCCHFLGDAGIELRGDYILSGTMPVTFCGMQRGDRFRMTLEGPGVERRIGNLEIDPSGRVSVSGLRLGAALRNAILPGSGSCHTDRRAAGWVDRLSLAASLYLLYLEDREFRDLEDDHDLLLERLAGAELLETRQMLELAAHETALEANVQNDHRKRLALFSAAIYGLQVIDPFLLSPPPRSSVEGGGSIIRTKTAESSRPKAFILSLLHPGRGQFYQGKTVRGMLFSALTAASGLAALEFHNRYDVEANRYEILVGRFEASESLSEKELLAREADIQWDEVEDARAERNAAYIITAGLWGWSLIDTLWRNDGGGGESRYSFEWSPVSGAIVRRF
ncbi:MAG TPA: hypothetical protein ENO08_04060 [Candidatus Eisenbacteria bacterium]|uniref:DUF5683 domain-containing protein n=1 Tax=Eiseniibacteriota bacterium TaxID=2212470 RepID=A0A7V2AUQ0_UNCEI|nr:hypothetical protein [Candidatus Eisenbacteria bacterium]